MYAKVFAQIFDSSIADDFRLRHFFMDLLVLADPNGCVDMTPAALAARTRIPLEEVKAMLHTLEQPDPESRTPDADGRRIARLDEHRSWGWHIINYSRFRSIVSEDQRREKTKERTRRWREKLTQKAPIEPGGDAPVTPRDAGDAMQKQMQMQRNMQKEREREMQMKMQKQKERESESERARSQNQKAPSPAPVSHSQSPSWDEFWEYCQDPACGLTAEWYARYKWEVNAQGWDRIPDWRAYARRCKGWWEADGRTLSPPNSLNTGNTLVIPQDSARLLERLLTGDPSRTVKGK